MPAADEVMLYKAFNSLFNSLFKWKGNIFLLFLNSSLDIVAKIWQLQQPGVENEALYRGELAVSLVLLLCSSVWMASNHRWEADMARRRRNTRIELGYCCAQLCAAFLTVRFGLGLAGAVLMIAAACVYVLYVNPRFMGRKLTK